MKNRTVTTYTMVTQGETVKQSRASDRICHLHGTVCKVCAFQAHPCGSGMIWRVTVIIYRSITALQAHIDVAKIVSPAVCPTSDDFSAVVCISPFTVFCLLQLCRVRRKLR